MENLHSFVSGLSHLEVPRDAEWVELDLVEMFPNIPRGKVPTAVQHFWSTMCEEKHLHKESSGFRVHKPGLRPLDSISAAGNHDSSYQFFPIHDVLLLLSWKKCAHYRSSHVPCAYAMNVCNVVKVVIAKQYSVNWWRPQLPKKATSRGLEHEAPLGMQLAVSCEPRVE